MIENTNCPYIIYKKSMSCASCTGYRCTSAGREKKVDETQLETCRDINEYVDCVRYLETLPVNVEETIETEEPSIDRIDEDFSYTDDVKYFELPEIDEIQETVSTPVPIVKTSNPCGCGHPDVRESSCPYQGLPPVGMTSCLGIWCYGRNKNIRVDKTCVNWVECSVYAMSKYKGVPFYDA